MLETHDVRDEVASVLAVTIEVENHSIDALLLLVSGRFAFLGSLEYPNEELQRTPRFEMGVNVVVASTLQGVEAEAARFVASKTNAPGDVEAMPWHVADFGVRKTRPSPRLVIYFCEQGILSERCAIVDDALLPEETDFEQWGRSFTQAYLSRRELENRRRDAARERRM